jgi:hypothetical protein
VNGASAVAARQAPSACAPYAARFPCQAPETETFPRTHACAPYAAGPDRHRTFGAPACARAIRGHLRSRDTRPPAEHRATLRTLACAGAIRDRKTRVVSGPDRFDRTHPCARERDTRPAARRRGGRGGAGPVAPPGGGAVHQAARGPGAAPAGDGTPEAAQVPGDLRAAETAERLTREAEALQAQAGPWLTIAQVQRQLTEGMDDGPTPPASHLRSRTSRGSR